MLFSLSFMYAQKGFKKSPEQRAELVTSEMKEVLSLNNEETKLVYTIQLAKFSGIYEANKLDSQELIKAEKKKLTKQAQNELKSLLTEDRFSKWTAHKKQSKSKS